MNARDERRKRTWGKKKRKDLTSSRFLLRIFSNCSAVKVLKRCHSAVPFVTEAILAATPRYWMKALKLPLGGPLTIRINCPAKHKYYYNLKYFFLAIPKIACGLLSNRISHILMSPDLISKLNSSSLSFSSFQPGSIIFLHPA